MSSPLLFLPPFLGLQIETQYSHLFYSMRNRSFSFFALLSIIQFPVGIIHLAQAADDSVYDGQFLLDSLDGTDGIIIQGLGNSDEFGLPGTLTLIGDVNDDGIDDFAVSSEKNDAGGTDAGAAYVIFGSNTPYPNSFDLTGLDGTNGFSIQGAANSDRLGNWINEAGDVNGDGIDDFLVSEYLGGTSRTGLAHVIFGKNTAFNTTFDLSSLNGSNGFTIVGDASEDQLGEQFTDSGDFNGDDFSDILVISRTAGTAGEAYIIFGQSATFPADLSVSDLDGSNGFEIRAGSSSDGDLESAANAGDVNGDGIDDIILGFNRADVFFPTFFEAGLAFVIYGNTDFSTVLSTIGPFTFFQVSTIDGTNGIEIKGTRTNERVGSAVNGIGDWNQDGFDDMFIHGSSSSPRLGYVVFGGDALPLDFRLANLDGTNGFTVNVFQNLRIGASGDFNGDGISDLALSTPDASPDLKTFAGQSYVLFGNPQATQSDYSLSDFDGVQGFVLDGALAGDSSGRWIDYAGDVNADGLDDLLVGADRVDVGPNVDAGAVYLVYGQNGYIWQLSTGGELTTAGNWSGGRAPSVFGPDVTLTLDPAFGGEITVMGVDLDIANLDIQDGTADTTLRILEGSSLTSRNSVSGDGMLTIEGTLDVTEGADTVAVSTELEFTGTGALNIDLRSTPTMQVQRGITAGGTLNVSFIEPVTITEGSEYVLIEVDDSVDPSADIAGQFAGLPEGATVFDTGTLFLNITYQGGDGDDLALIASTESPNTFSDGVVNLSTLNGTTGYRLDGVRSGDSTGGYVGTTGDINGDGFEDFLIGAEQAQPDGQPFQGAVYVVFGKGDEFEKSFDLGSLDGTNGFRLDGAESNDFLGASNFAGDVNNDGIDDLVVGASGAGSGGRAYVIYGSNEEFPASLDVDTLDGTVGVQFDAADIGEQAGWSVKFAGDVNGDGIDDLLIATRRGTPASGSFDEGEVYVVFGQNGSFNHPFDLGTLDGSNGFILEGVDEEDRVSDVSSAGDFNGDGFDDVIYGTRTADPNGSNSGTAYVVFGRSSFNSTFPLSSLDGSNGFRVNGKAAGDFFGGSVSNAGDVNRDGFDDIVVGASGVDSSSGESYVIFGGATFGPTLELSSLDGTKGFSIPALESGDASGNSVARAGDVNGDGFSDVLIGARFADPNGAATAGQSYVLFGQSSFGASFDLASLDGTNGFFINGADSGDLAGEVGNGGDHNGDGVDEIIIGAITGDGKALSNSGEAYILFGELAYDWLPLGGGDLSTNANWSGKIAPQDSGGFIRIDPLEGGAIIATGVSVEIDRLHIQNGISPTSVSFDSLTTLQITESVTGDGALEVAGNLALGRSPGRVTVDPDFTFQNSTVTQFEINGTNEGQFDQLILKGTTLLDGNLILTIDPQVEFSDGEVIKIIDVQGDLSGTFAGLAEGDLVATFGFFDLFISYLGGDGNDITLTVDEFGPFDWALSSGGLFAEDSAWRGGSIPVEADTMEIAPAAGGTITAENQNLTVDTLTLLNGDSETILRFDPLSDFQITGSILGDGELIPEGRFGLGESPNTVSVDADLTFGESTEFNLKVNGAEPGEYDQLILNGVTSLDGVASLQVDSSFTPTDGDTFLLVDVRGAISGLFDSSPEGSIIQQVGLVDLIISYGGGDGNDVVVTAVEVDPITWLPPGGGSFSSSTNWRGGVPPEVLDELHLAPEDGGTVTLSDYNQAVGNLFFNDGSSNSILRIENTGSLSIGSSASGTGELVIAGGLSIGDSIGPVTVENDLTFEDTAALEMEIDGTAEGQFDQLILQGATTLDGTLVLTIDPSVPFTDGEVIQLIDVQGTASGTFNLFPEGKIVERVGLFDLVLSYQGGDGNDVVLTAIAADPLVWLPYGGGNFDEPANWRGAEVPNNLENFLFTPENGGTVSVSNFDLSVGNLTFNDGFSESILRIEESGNLFIGSSVAGTGELVIAGGLSAGDPLELVSFQTDLTFEDTARLEMDIHGIGEGEFDRIALAGLTQLGGALEVRIDPDFNPTGGDTFLFGDVTGGISGTFADLPEGASVLTSDSTGFHFVISYQGGDGNDLELKVVGSFWDDATKLDSEWRSVDWLGRIFVRQAPWIYHLRLGWIYDPPNIVQLEDRWLYIPELGWVWTSESLFPFLYRASSSNWLYFQSLRHGTTFYDYATNSIIEIGNE